MWQERTPVQQQRAIELIAELDALPKIDCPDPLADTAAILGISELTEFERFYVQQSMQALGGR